MHRRKGNSILLRRIVSRAVATVAGLVLAAGVVTTIAPGASAAPAKPTQNTSVVFSYHIFNYNADLNLAVQNGTGTNAELWTEVEQAKDQIWTTTLQNSQGYNILENMNGKCLGISGGSKAGGAQAVAWSCNGHLDQQWTVIDVKNTPPVIFELKNRNSGMCLGVWQASTSQGAAVIQWPCNGHLDQRWFLQR